MTENAASALKARLRTDLRSAMKNKRTPETNLIRALIAAIDNAEAPPAKAASTQHRFLDGSAETERLPLSPSDLRQIVLAEIEAREHAATELEHHNQKARAEILRTEAELTRRYIE